MTSPAVEPQFLSRDHPDELRLGRMLKSVVRLGTPSVLEALLTSAILLTDALMLARLENNTMFLAAAAVSGVWFWRLVNMVGCTHVGAGAYVARRWGEEEFEEANRAATYAPVLAAAIGFCFAILFAPLVGPIFRLYTDDPLVASTATGYFLIVLLAFPVRLAILSMTSVMRAAGDTISPLIIIAVGVVTNLFLNWVLIFGNLGAPRLEMNGAAIATALTFTLELALGLALLKRGVRPRRLMPSNVGTELSLDAQDEMEGQRYAVGAGREGGMLRLHRGGFRLWDKTISPRVLRVSRAALGEEIIYSVGFLAFLYMVARFGSEVLAAHSATVRIESLSFTIGWGVAIATSTMVGQALGAMRPQMATRLFSLNTTLGIVAMGLLGIAFVTVPDFFLSWFQLEGKTLDIGRVLMIIIGIEQFAIASGMTLAGGLKGAGDTRSPFITQIFGVLGMRVLGGYILAWPLGMGIEGIYWATALDWTVRSIILGYFVWRGRWKRVVV